MSSYNVKLLKKEEITEGTLAVYFEKPSGFAFKAGQNADFKLINPPEMDAEGPVRTFSFADAPQEPNIILATRLRDTAFKRTLKNMPIGGEIAMEGPLGSFTLHNDTSKPAVFLIGGIGITPVRSILVDAAQRKLPHKLFLFYSNNRPEDAAFLEELQDLEKQNPNYKFIGTMTKMPARQSLGDGGAESEKPWNGSPAKILPGKTWAGETGYITKEMIQKYIGNMLAPIYYMSGPQSLVAAMRKLLNDAGVNDDYIKTEEFSGY